MEALAENWFFVAVLLLCVGVHVFGHGHGHSHRNEPGRNEDASQRQEAGEDS